MKFYLIALLSLSSLQALAFPWLAKVETTTCKGQGMEYSTVWDGSYGIGYKEVKLNGKVAFPQTMKVDFEKKEVEQGMILKEDNNIFTITTPNQDKFVSAKLVLDGKTYELSCTQKSKYKMFDLKDEDKDKIEHMNNSERSAKEIPEKYDLKIKSPKSGSKQ